MRLRNWVCGPLALAAGLLVPARADDAKPAAPAVVVRLKSFDGLMADAKYLAGFAGQEEQARQAEAMIRALAGPKGLAGTGIDTTRPFGLYGVVTPAGVDSYAALMIPVADEKGFVETVTDLTGRFGVKVTKGEAVYTVTIPNSPVDAYFTVANGYAYVTAKDKDTLDPSRRIAPAKVFPTGNAAVAAVTIRLDQIPDQLKQIALSQLEVQMSAAKDQKARGETEAQAKLKAQMVDHAAMQIKSLLADGQRIELQVGIDRQAAELSADLILDGKPGSPLAQEIRALADQTSALPALGGLAFQAGLHLAVPAQLRDAIAAVVDEGFAKAVNDEKDVAKKFLAQRVFAVIGPTVKAGRLDVTAGLQGPDAGGHYTGYACLTVQDSAAIEKLVKELVPTIPAKERAAIKLDAATISGTAVHVIEPPADMVPADQRRVFGGKPAAFIAFPEGSIAIAFGNDPAGAVKGLLDSRAPKPVQPLALQASVGRLAPLDNKKGPVAKQVAEDVFGGGQSGKDVVRFVVEGGPALKMRASMKAEIIRFGTNLKEKAESSP
jgi:hypothetical protein